MKKSEIKAALSALKTIKMPKIEDKELRNLIIDDHFALLKAQKALEEDVKDLEEAHLGAYKDEREAVGELQQKLQSEADRTKQAAIAQEIQGHKDLIKAVKDYNEAVNTLADGEVEVKPIDREKFMAEIEKQDYTLDLIEQLYPLFN